ncbi:NAD(P)H-dependent glycerol-3-phosphate dehydrogenase [Bradymonas sediminis]|uniref:Glycerol-3-phosphate dehydrogenase [NAD(P)+] n=1 Tax=Bradymonas sediminis TaxID=1548548 RepID=A0A2Z4FNR2_9DELT|nr:NAD(P)H-dependent glycerol-3-phosphate dehydrogenase [Bradymonas sediminis]AWV90619.1 NAD(P)-dependent glycerol-3-phosphate dehydrogenase [Bradymonas sediminis]TDP62381.1 glycerol 3-phosphate dehydrogenase (NAD(P)+) [Bradymonas sediminis]
MKIGVIGAGSWGTALAKLLAENGHDIMMWAHDKPLPEQINVDHENPVYLPGFTLPKNLRATGELAEAVVGQELILSVVPSHVLRKVLVQLAPLVEPGTPFVSATKGIENETQMLVSDILEDVLPEHCLPYLAYLSGPSFAREVADHKPTAVTIASFNHRLAERVQRVFSNDVFRAYTTTDVVGVEVGGALKNVIAIAAGGIAGMELGSNSMAGMITRGLHEITRLGVTIGANPLTLSGLAGMGDLVLTCTGGLSRNRSVGVKLGQGYTIEEILSEMNMVAEGVKTARSVHDLAAKLGVEMPICDQVYRVIYEGKSTKDAVHELMKRDLKPELKGLY